jgi:hypothetical protein
MFSISDISPLQADRDEVQGALASLSFAVALVVDAAGESDAQLQRSARNATVALADALVIAAGRPSHQLWREARALVAEFISDAEQMPLADGARAALSSLRGFVAENDDLARTPDRF